ncbi:G2 M phase-specific E3 ubiquitin- ligase [Paramuricea clavata]|uniref:G2 M phase-specific E3 ubiquitin- ligase n=1 Tax=Paramuricea clavata TaxID=317549 RepID=A0A7D9DXV5_PARCT|nr:G2 M phase-specific E3 ubiquitin- ligase [Paramuricea clavata]
MKGKENIKHGSNFPTLGPIYLYALGKQWTERLQIKRYLNLEPLEPTEIPKVKDIGPVQKCINCQQEFPLHLFRQHMVNCPGGSSRSSGGQNDVSSGESSGGESHAPSVQLITLDEGGQSGASTSGAAGQSSDVRSGGLNTVSLEVLKEMFPHIPEADLKDAFQNNFFDVDSTIEELLENAAGGETEIKITGGSMEEILRAITPSVANAPQRISISRDHLLTDSISFFKRREFDNNSLVRVVFEGEPAVDGGGPKREYFSLLLQSLVAPSSPIRLFEGRGSFILPMHNMDAIRAGMFKVAGRMITTSVINGGPGFPYVPPVLYNYLISPTGEMDKALTEIKKEDVVDLGILEAIQKLSLCTIDHADADNIEQISSEVQNALIDSGYTKVLNMSNKLEAITALCVHSVILSRKAAID